jgi:CspA family cold shock protein
MQGRVKWFDNRRGYGFILGEDGTEVYVHYTALQGEGFKSLKHNWRVSYEVATMEDGRIEARNVKVLR